MIPVDFKEQTLSMGCETRSVFSLKKVKKKKKTSLDKYNKQYNTALVYALIYKSQMIYRYQYVLIIAKIPVQEDKSCTWMITTGVTYQVILAEVNTVLPRGPSDIFKHIDLKKNYCNELRR